MENFIRGLLKEKLNDGVLTKKDFYKKYNIDPDELSFLGSGDFGTAYSIDGDRVLKITNSKSEFRLAKELVGEKKPVLDGFVDYYSADIVEGYFYIIMEELEEDYEVEDLYYSLLDLLDSEGLPIQYIHMLDTDELNLDDSLLSFIDDIEDINTSYRYLGVQAGDIKPDNIGVSNNGKYKAFDIDDKSVNEIYK